MMKPDKVCQIVTACTRLQNLCIDYNVPHVDEGEPLVDVEQPDFIQADLPDVGAVVNRQNIVRLFHD